MPDPAGRDFTRNINEYIQSLLASKQLGSQVVFHHQMPPRPPELRPVSGFVSSPVEKMLADAGISSLYSHQHSAIQAVRDGRHVVTATPTASGKTLIYTIPFFELFLKNPQARALYLFPLKALAQDQLRTFKAMAASLPHPTPNATLDAAVYDGDTTAWFRKKIRCRPPAAILTNPEMLHLSFLPFHGSWRQVFENLQLVVVDEVHTYRGVLGSHMAQIFRRFQRVCEGYGARPKFIFSSATIANPGELCKTLISRPVSVETRSGAPGGRQEVVFINPENSPSHTAILLLKAALHRGLRTIVYTQSRKLTELIAVWATRDSGKYADKISAYRSGFLAEERREIEKKLMSGELLAVISTSALELGIDIGDLDLCLLVGYPGTVMSTWQRGGRVGRRGHDSAMVLIAGEDALDQYFMRHPEAFFTKGPEAAVINPDNPDILKKHLTCAAAELPLDTGEAFVQVPSVASAIGRLEAAGDLLRSEDGTTLYAARKQPHRNVDLRGTGSRFTIVDHDTGDHRGEVDGFRAFRETHPGAVYLHMGKTFRVETFDPGAQMVTVRPANPVYYTRVRADKQTEIMAVDLEKQVFSTRICFGRLKVTDQVIGYEKIHIYGKKRINIMPLSLPPQVFETQGIWIEIPSAVQADVENEFLHFMGGIHALEHAMIGICPLLILTDRNDFGGISTPFHPQVQLPAVFVYDAFPGGIGLSRQAYHLADEMLRKTLETVTDCPCSNGCPSCVHSPKCGSGNRPIDKAAAIFMLQKIMASDAPVPRKNPGAMLADTQAGEKPETPKIPNPLPANKPLVQALQPLQPDCHYGVFDIETQKSAQEVGGWHLARRMKISCAVVYDAALDRYFEYFEQDVPELIAHLQRLERVIGFNIKRFDYKVLAGYSDFDFLSLPTLDLLESVHQHLGYRLSLNNLAQASLGAEKSADGLQALRWWKQGELGKIAEYCRKDVEITHAIYQMGREKGFLLFKNKAGQRVRVPVAW